VVQQFGSHFEPNVHLVALDGVFAPKVDGTF
jgi:hypothetical protein